MTAAEIEKIIEPLVDQAGAEIVDVTFAKEGPKWVLRVFLDKEGGVTLDDCGYFSERIGSLIDSMNVIPQSYVLEVSSPGIDRLLRKEKDFLRFAGQAIELRLKVHVPGQQRHFRGILEGFRDGRVVLKVGEESREFPLEEVDEARLDAVSHLKF